MGGEWETVTYRDTPKRALSAASCLRSLTPGYHGMEGSEIQPKPNPVFSGRQLL